MGTINSVCIYLTIYLAHTPTNHILTHWSNFICSIYLWISIFTNFPPTFIHTYLSTYPPSYMHHCLILGVSEFGTLNELITRVRKGFENKANLIGEIIIIIMIIILLLSSSSSSSLKSSSSPSLSSSSTWLPSLSLPPSSSSSSLSYYYHHH